MLYPQQNRHRSVLDLSGIWDFRIDGDAKARPIAVPCSWNDLFDDARDSLGLAWYERETYVPPAWRDQRVFLRIGSANYAAKVWVNGALVAQHLGGHLPFAADVTPQLLWDRPNRIVIAVENEPRPERVPPGGAGDFFPYSGLHRPVVLYSVPLEQHIDDIAIVTTIEGSDGIVNVRVATAQAYGGSGTAELNGSETELHFRDGVAEAVLRVPHARFWSPRDPHLYPLTISIPNDAYTLDIGIRTIEVRGEQLLLNGEPIRLTGFGKHEDFPLYGRGLDLPMWIRDYELLRWIGANSYRTSHYPYSEEAMALADRLGILVINEIPAVGLDFEAAEERSAAWLEQSKAALRELIARDRNHPSTILWSVANEPLAAQTPEVIATGTRFLQALYDEARRLDPTRPVTMAGIQDTPHAWHALFDVVAINRYYGWYLFPGRLELAMEALARELDEFHAAIGKPIVLTEFGAEAIPGTHSLPPEMWSEEYQVELIRGVLDVAAQRSFVAGTHVWAFADFKTPQSIGRAGGMNFKGVFTRDRRPKMAAHFLRSRWGAPSS